MSSLWNRSGTVERFADDLRAIGAKAYFFEGGTTSQLVVFQDSAQSAAHPIPVLADADGRWPDIFVPYITSYDVRVTSADDVLLTFTQQIPNPNPIDVPVTPPVGPEDLVQTGMIHAELINTTKSGYVRLNGRTLGNAASGATERANADTVDLFTYLWSNLLDTVAPVSGGRGASAAADYAVNKTIRLPDARGSVLMGLDGMGNALSGAINATINLVSGSPDTPGSELGNNQTTLVAANIPSVVGTTSAVGDHQHSVSASGSTGTDSVGHTHTFSWSGTTGDVSNDHTHTYTQATTAGIELAVTPGGTSIIGHSTTNTGGESTGHTHNYSGTAATNSENTDHTHSYSFTVNSTAAGGHSHSLATNAGANTTINNAPFGLLVTWYIKL